MANLAFRLLQKNNINNLKYFYINTPGLLSVPKEYIQNGNYRLYLGQTFYNEDAEVTTENKYLITNSVYYYLNNKNINNIRFVPWYNTICNIKKDTTTDYKETAIVLDAMYSIPLISKLNDYNDIFEKLSEQYNPIYIDSNYLNYLTESATYNKNKDISSKVVFVDNDNKHSFDYRNIFIIDLDNVDSVVNLSFLKFAFLGMHLDYINIVWHNTSNLTDSTIKNYLSLLNNESEFKINDEFTSCKIDLTSLSSKIIYWENVSYKILSNITNDYFSSCTDVLSFNTMIDTIGGEL